MHQFFLFGVTWFLPMVGLLVWLEYAVFPPERLETLTGGPFVLPGLEMGLPFFYLVVFNAALIVIRVFAFALGKRARG
jgi:hypothetical protein